MFAKRDKHYLSRSWQTSLATALTNFTKLVTKINSGPSKCTLVLILAVHGNWGRPDADRFAKNLTLAELNLDKR